MRDLENALHALADDGTTPAAAPDLADRALARARSRGRHRGALATAGVAALVAAVAVGATTLGREQLASPRPAPAATTDHGFARDRMNVLVLGVDSGPDRVGTRPDTVMLASVDTRTGAATLFGLPRNLERVPFPAGTPAAAAYPRGFVCADHECLLNSLWTWAEGSGRRYYPGAANPGLAATTQGVEGATGVKVDDTVVIDMQGLVKLVDAVGGVTVDVTERLPIGGNAEDPTAKSWIEKGRQHLTGYQALWYARSRWSTNDLDRMTRQRCLLAAVRDQLDVKQLITAWPRISSALKGSLTTSMTPDELLAWLRLAGRTQADTRLVGLVPPDRSNPDYAALRTTVARYTGSEPAPGATRATPGTGGSSSKSKC